MAFMGYTVLDELGSGAFGATYVATRQDSPGTLFAAKFVDHDKVDESSRRSEERALRSLTGHPHVVEHVEVRHSIFYYMPIGTCSASSYFACNPQTLTGIRRIRKRLRGSEGEQVLTMIVTKCNPRQGINEYIAHQPFSERLARIYLEQLLSALSHAHSNGISHADVKVRALPRCSPLPPNSASANLTPLLMRVRHAAR
jgi:serine/threonine protein kinase